jgi:hypothetical protein
MGLRLLGRRDEQDLVDLVDLDELHLDALTAGGGQVLAHVVGTDRKLSVASVGEHGELHPGRPAIVEQRLDRRPNRPAGVEDIVDEHAGHALERKVELRRANDRLCALRRLAGSHLDIVAIEGDVEVAELELPTAEVRNQRPESLCERHPARLDPYQCDALELRVALDDLVRDPRERPLDRLGVEENFLE